MKRYFSAAVAAAALMLITGCEGREEPPTQVSTSDPSAGITSNYTSQSLQAESVTSSIDEKTIETVTTETATVETETVTAVSTSAASTSAADNNNNNSVSATAATSSAAVAAKTTTSTKQASNGNGGQAAETTSSSSTASHIQTTTTSETTSQLPDTTTRPLPAHDEIIEAYIREVEKKIDSMTEEGSENIYIDYTLYDMDGNGIPELIIKWGSEYDDYQITFYTYDEFGTKIISDGTPGENAGFACVSGEVQFVLAYSDMYKASLFLMDYEDLNKDMLPDYEFTYGSEETFEAKMAECGIERLPFARYSSQYEENTILYRVVGGELESDEIAGRDFSFIYDYQF